jgi:glycosyltransferase involved in cell wall biosynthesis
MMRKPVVSVLTPVYNCAETLGLALASLQAQTFEGWECVVVDDGSSDNPGAVVADARDHRIRYCHLGRNRGRGYARQWALDAAQGQYIAWLDGDDWIFPEKLEMQLDLLLREPETAAVSTGMAIVNERLELVGIQGQQSGSAVSRNTLRAVGGVPMAFAPSVMRAELAKRTGFAASYAIAEDTDFLLRALFGKRYAVINTPLYVYKEIGCTTLTKVLTRLDATCNIYWSFRGASMPRRAHAVGVARFKQAVYRASAALGRWDQIIARRSREPLASERMRYRDVLHRLTKMSHPEERHGQSSLVGNCPSFGSAAER